MTFEITYRYRVEIEAESMEQAVTKFQENVPYSPKQVDDKSVYFYDDTDDLIENVLDIENGHDITDDFIDEFDSRWE